MSINPYEPSRVPSPRIDRHPFEFPGELEFELTSDDFIAFNLDFARHSTANRLILGCAGASCVLLALALLLYYVVAFQPAPMEIVGSAFSTATFVLILSLLIGWLVWRGTPTFVMGFVVRALLMAGDSSSLLGQYWLRLTPEEIFERAPKAEHRFPMSAVQKLVLCDQRLYIYVSPLSALIIPGRALDDPKMLEPLGHSLQRLSGVPFIQR
jgi:hypothetical protein